MRRLHPFISALRMAVGLRLTSWVVMKSPEGELGGWFKNHVSTKDY
jgi:hypothetical protein